MNRPYFLLVLIALSLFATPPAHAATYVSEYTSIQEEDCTTLAIDHIGSVQSCKGFGNIKVEVIEGDLRQSITLRRMGTAYPLNFQGTVSPYMSMLGSKIEWCFENRKPHAIPFAMITRLKVSARPESPEKTISYLVVSKITADTACVVGTIPPLSQQNKKARAMANRSATMPCLKLR